MEPWPRERTYSWHFAVALARRSSSIRGPVVRPSRLYRANAISNPPHIANAGAISTDSRACPSRSRPPCPRIITSHFDGICSCASHRRLPLRTPIGAVATRCHPARFSSPSIGLDKARLRAPTTLLVRPRAVGNSEQQLQTAGCWKPPTPACCVTRRRRPIVFLACPHSLRRQTIQNDPTVNSRRVVEGERNGIEQEIEASQQKPDGPTSQYDR